MPRVLQAAQFECLQRSAWHWHHPRAGRQPSSRRGCHRLRSLGPGFGGGVASSDKAWRTMRRQRRPALANRVRLRRESVSRPLAPPWRRHSWMVMQAMSRRRKLTSLKGLSHPNDEHRGFVSDDVLGTIAAQTSSSTYWSDQLCAHVGHSSHNLTRQRQRQPAVHRELPKSAGQKQRRRRRQQEHLRVQSHSAKVVHAAVFGLMMTIQTTMFLHRALQGDSAVTSWGCHHHAC
mmetsp:Transcript_4374/g.7511  ORF Transcript_4374/g.7511 Transcript_4374/m.7511 type:complete len:233 (-) Transcript_4374:800-1498(-)